MNTETVFMEAEIDDEWIWTAHKAATARGDKVHVAYKRVQKVEMLGRPAGFVFTDLKCGTAVSYRFVISKHEMTQGEWDQVTCTKCKPSLKGGAA